MPKLKALAFDAYGTLFDVHSVIAACEGRFPRQGVALSRLWRAKQLEYTWLLSLMGRYEDFWNVTGAALRVACRALELPLDAATEKQLLRAYLELEPFPDVQGALEALAERYTLVILSNGTSRMLKELLECAGWERLFAQVLSADEAKIYKPHPQVYELASRKLGLERGEIGFVSSNFWDVAGAKAFGFWTFWANRIEQPPEELGLVPDATGRTLTDLVRVLGRKD
jgi:2-haloacid dehalogenase